MSMMKQIKESLALAPCTACTVNELFLPFQLSISKKKMFLS